MSSKSKKHVSSLKDVSRSKIISSLPQDEIDSLVETYLKKQHKKKYNAVLYFKMLYNKENVTNTEFYKFLVQFFDKLDSSSKKVKKLLLEKIIYEQIFLNFHSFIKENNFFFEEKVSELIALKFSMLSEANKINKKHITLKNTSILINAVIREYEDDIDVLNETLIIEEIDVIFSNGFSVDQSQEMIKILNMLDPVNKKEEIYPKDLFAINSIPKYSYFSMRYNIEEEKVYDIYYYDNISKGTYMISDGIDDVFFMYQFK